VSGWITFTVGVGIGSPQRIGPPLAKQDDDLVARADPRGAAKSSDSGRLPKVGQTR
jgi:hypothetical protein